MKAGALAFVALLAVAGCALVPGAKAQFSPPKNLSPSPTQPARIPAQQPPQPPKGQAAAAPMTPAQEEEMHGDIFMAKKMYSDAIKTYQDLLLASPEDARILNKEGICFQQLGDLKQAERYYKKSVKADKQFASPLNNLGTVEFGKHKYKGAIKDYQKAVKVDPTMATAFGNMGYAYLARKKVKEAILAFRQAILLDPEIFVNRGDLASVVEQRGNMDQGFYYYTLAKTFAMLGDAEHCAHYLKMARDEGYKKYTEALKDPVFKPVLKDPRIQLILAPPAADSAMSA